MFYRFCGGRDMKKIKQYSSLLFVCLICTCMAVSCKKDEAEILEPTAAVTAAQTNVPEALETPETMETPKAANGTVDEKSETTEAPQETKKAVATTIPIYSIDNETLETKGVVAELSEGQELNAEFIVQEVVKSFSDQGVEIGIYSITEKDDSVYVSFEKDKAPVADVGSSVEMAILDSISQSLLDNLDTCQKVYFKVEDGAYESGHNVFEEDEPYTWK